MENPVKLCRTCKKDPAEGDRAQYVCSGCRSKIAAWLDGGPHLVPEWNGVVSDPTASYPDSSLHRALVLQDHRRRGTLGS